MSHVGATEFQRPSVPQVVVFAPFSVYPWLHEYVAWLPGNVPDDVSTNPLVGFERTPQSTTLQTGAEPLHVLSEPHVLVNDPDS